MEKITLRYYDTKLHTVYTLEHLRSEYYDETNSDHRISFEEWLDDLIENEILIPLS